MRLLRHALALTIAFALAASGVASSQCAATPHTAGLDHMTAVKRVAHHDHQTVEHHGMGHHGMGHQAMDDQAMAHGGTSKHPVPADDHACMNCCAMCTVAGALPPVGGEATLFSVSPVAFSRHHEEWSANAIAVDPGIPKRIA